MTKKLAPTLDPELAALPVDPEAMRQWFFLPAEIETALAGPVTVGDVRALLGSTGKHNKKAGATAVLLLTKGIVTDEVLATVEAVLALKPRDLEKRGSVVTWIGSPEVWIDEDRPDGQGGRHNVRSRLGDEETLALRVIEHVRLFGPTRSNKLAVRDLLAWFGQQGRSLTALAVNAFAAVVGAVDTETGEVSLPGHDPKLLATEAIFNARELHIQAGEETVRLAKAIGHKTLERMAATADAFQAAVENGADPEKLLAEPRSPNRWTRLVSLTGLTQADLLALAGEPASLIQGSGLKEAGLKKQTAWDLRQDDRRLDVVVNAELKRLGETERAGEQFRKMQVDAFAAASGDPQAKARLRAKAAIPLP